jgi:hypothetical protein
MNLPDFKLIDVRKLILDDSSPRIPKILRGSERGVILNHYLLKENISKLMISISQKGFHYAEPFLVMGLANNEFKVIDGNRRLAAITILGDINLVKDQKSLLEKIIYEVNVIPKEIPCLIFRDLDDIYQQIGFKHITGNMPWNMIEKARYIQTIASKYSKECNFDSIAHEIAKMLGTRKNYIKNLILSLQIYEFLEKSSFFHILDLDEDSFNFYFLSEILKDKAVCDFLEIDWSSNYPYSDLNFGSLEKMLNCINKHNSSSNTKITESKRISTLISMIENQSTYPNLKS